MKDMTSKIYFSPDLRAQWPDPLARLWSSQYPKLFDEDDLRLVLNQGRYHFYEWFVAIHLFHRDGALSLLEKYAYANHARKRGVLIRILSPEQLLVLDDMRKKHRVQPPDLFVYTRDHRFWFAEAKGPGDRLSAKQLESHCFITEQFQVPVQVFQVCRGMNQGGLYQCP